MNIKSAVFILVIAFLVVACDNQKRNSERFINENIAFAVAQTELMLQNVGTPTGRNYPRSMNDEGELTTTNMYEWTPGFFPGSLWHLYELTGDPKWREHAREWTQSLEPLRTFTRHHDLGFMMFDSFGNALRLAPKPTDKEILIESAHSLATRFNHQAGVMRSWNNFRSWNSFEPQYQLPVIIDNLMNLELLFWAANATGDRSLYDIAVQHADFSIKHFFRDDYSTYHLVAVDPYGEILGKYTAQGFSDNSTWARGQAWAIYGLVMTYRETGYERFRNMAIGAANFFINNLPEELVPLWDFNVQQEGFIPGPRSRAVVFQEKLHDASAAAIVAATLFELGELVNQQHYIDTAQQILRSLASPSFRAELGTNANFILMHSVGSIPHWFEVDRPLVYADYYFLKALTRYRRWINR